MSSKKCSAPSLFLPNKSDDRSKNKRPIPKSDTILDLEKLGFGKKLRKALIPLVIKIPGWDDVSHENDIELQRISGALTNSVFFVNAGNRKVVLRIYGSEQLIDRVKELNFLKMISTPKLLSIFGNGRFEEYLESTTLTHEDLRDPSVSKDVAILMRQLHNIIFPLPQEDIELELWINVDKWYPLALETVNSNSHQYTEEQRKDLEEFDLKSLKYEINELKDRIDNINSPIVFAHNDVQYGNILRLTNGRLAVVDFEYSGYNYMAFDLANHFCEWMYNYHSKEPHKMDVDSYPNEDQQKDFIRSYINTDHTILSPSSLSDNNYLQKMKSDVRIFTLASHLMWGLWGLIKSGQNQEIDFDYFSYGMERLRRLRVSKNEIFMT